MPDILLIQPPVEDFYLTAKRTMPYGLACVAGALRLAGFSVDLLDALAAPKSRPRPWPEDMDFLQPFFGRNDRSPTALFHRWRHFGRNPDHLARRARESGAFLIGIASLFTAYAESALAAAAAVKKACPEATVVLGGHHPTALPAAAMQSRAVDYVLRGEGEVSMPLLARVLRAGGDPGCVPGLVQRRPDGSLQASPPAFAPRLEDLPMPAFDLIDWRYYRRAGRAAAAISAGRGCPHRCTYCGVNAAAGHPHRCRPVAAVMAELEEIDRTAGLGFIDFEDEHLCAERGWFMDLLGAIQARFAGRGIELRAMNGLYAPSLDEEMIGRMQAAGFKTLNLALITTAAAQLRRFGRPDVGAEVDRVLRLAELKGMQSVAYIMVGGPEQDPRASVSDLLFLAQRRVLAGVSVFYPAPGSSDYRWCESMGLLPTSFGALRATALPLAHATDRVQSVTLLRLGRLLNFMKQLMDSGVGLPKPAPAPHTLPAHIERSQAGRILLAAFLRDGIIRGLDEDGSVYAHRIDRDLARAFRDGLARVELRGAKAGVHADR